MNRDEIIGTFYEKELQKTNQQEFRTEKVIKRKDDKLYVKWKGYDSSFNSLIDKKRLNQISVIPSTAIPLYKNESTISILTLELTCLIMQQKQISKIFRMLILAVLHCAFLIL